MVKWQLQKPPLIQRYSKLLLQQKIRPESLSELLQMMLDGFMKQMANPSHLAEVRYFSYKKNEKHTDFSDLRGYVIEKIGLIKT